MKIRTANNDNLASAGIDYQPSQCFQMVAKEFKFDKKEESGKSVNDEIARNISIFIDMLEIVNMHLYSSAICFNKALEGLITGMAADMAINYCGEYNEKMPLEQLLALVKKQIYRDKEYIIENNYFTEEEPPGIIENKPRTNNVIKLKKSLK